MKTAARRSVGEGRTRSLQSPVLSPDRLIALGVALLTIGTRFPMRSHRVFNWDAVNFVLALSDYDVRLHHPHPPGYPVFVAMGRVLGLVIPDANGSLVAVAMLLSAGAVAALYLLGMTLFDRATGIVAALYLLVSVTFWTNGAVALAYASLALFGILVASFAWQRRSLAAIPWSEDVRLPAREMRYALALSAAYAIGGGFRPDLLLFLAPLWLWGHWRMKPRQIALSAAVGAALVLAWFVPTVALSGGWVEYWKVFRAYASNDVLKRYSVAQNGPKALIVNLRDTAKYTGYALYALALPVGGAAVWLAAQARQWRQPRVALFALWIAPMLLFYAWVHIGDPGYVLTFVPALLLLAARFTTALPKIAGRVTRAASIQRVIAPALVACVLLANTVVFLFRPLTLTAPGIRRQDATIDGKIAYVHAHGDPATTLLISYESYRHWLLYLPEYHVQFVDVTYGTEADRTVALPPGTTQAILMDDTLLRAITNAQATQAAPIQRDRVAIVAAPTAPLHFNPIASPLSAPSPAP